MSSNGTQVNWITRKDFPAALASCSKSTLLHWREVGCPPLNGKKLRAKQDPVDNRRRLYWKPDVLEVIKRRPSQPTPEHWLTAKELVAAGLSCGPGTLIEWRNVGCPLLDGRKLRSKRSKRHSHYVLYWKADVLTIVKRRSPLPNAFKDTSGFKWLSVDAATEKFGISAKSLRYYQHHGHPALGKKRLAILTKFGSANGSLVHARRYYRLDQLKKLEAAWRRLPAEAQWVRRSAAMTQAGVSSNTLVLWTQKGCPLLDGRKLRSRLRHGGLAGRAREYWRADVEVIEKQLAKKVSLLSPDRISHAGVCDLGVPTWVLQYWRDVRCPYLGGEKLQGRKETDWAAGGGLRPQWTYRRVDVQRIALASTRSANPYPRLATLLATNVAPVETPKRGRGRPGVRGAKEAVRLARLERWENAKAAGVSMSVFCEQEVPRILVDTLKGDIRWRSMRRLRERQKMESAG